MNAPLLERYGDRIAGVLTCYDRMVITGTLPGACCAAGMTSFLNAKGIRIFDYPKFAEPLRDRIRANAEAMAASAGVRIQFIAKAHIRKEAVVAEVIKTRGEHPGLVHVISVMEAYRRTALGMTSALIKRICAPSRVSVCTTTSTSLMPIWADFPCRATKFGTKRPDSNAPLNTGVPTSDYK